jgi:manganese transport protein
MNRKENINPTSVSLSEVHASVNTQQVQKRSFFKRFLSFVGPAYLVSVGYMDPGNWATDIEGGSRFGYKLLFVLLMSNLMAMVLQSLSARLGVVQQRDLAQANRETYPKFINLPLWLLAEIAIAATDLAEVIGMAIGLKLLTGLPLIYGVVITLVDTFILLYLQKLGIRKMEAFIIGLIVVILGSFAVQLFLAKPPMAPLAKGFIPTSLSGDALFIAIGIIGATVMPHNLYLHSALVQTRKISTDFNSVKQAIKMNTIDSVIALNIAFFVNAAILILAASTFNATGNNEVVKIEEAHSLLAPLLGSKIAPILFAIALIAAGQSSTITGTLAGQIVMEGYLRVRLNPIARRLITRLVAIVPAVLVLLINGDNNIDSLLVLSQVILSLQLAFAVIPLIHFVSNKQKMGSFAIKWPTKVIAWTIAVLLSFLNIKLVAEKLGDWFAGGLPIYVKLIIGIVLFGFAMLLLITIFYPWFNKKPLDVSVKMHATKSTLENIALPKFSTIAIALDFSKNDERLISYALGQGNTKTQLVLIHVVESATAKIYGKQSADYETQKDTKRLNEYQAILQAKGYECSIALGYRNRVSEIVRMVKEANADLLVIGAHGHKGLKDYLYGQTIDGVRHQINIPVFIVNN